MANAARLVQTAGYESDDAGYEGDDFRKRWDSLDRQLAIARDYLELLEADPETDELPLMIARNQLLEHKRALAKILAGED